MAGNFAFGDNYTNLGGDVYSGPLLSSIVGGRGNANYLTNYGQPDYGRPSLNPPRRSRASEKSGSEGQRDSTPEAARTATIEDDFDFGDIVQNPDVYALSIEDGQRVAELESSFNLLRNYVAHHNPEWLVRGGSLKAKGEHLTALASIATFLGLLQIGFMTFVADADLRSQRNPFNVLSYCALLVDSFGALFAVLAAGSFSLAASPTKDYTIPRQAIDLRLILRNIKVRKNGAVGMHRDREGQNLDAHDKPLIMENVKACKEACDRELKVAQALTKRMTSIAKLDTFEYPLILLFTSIGAYFFVISTIIFVVQTQPRVVSITIGTVAIVFTVIYAIFAVLHMWTRISPWLSSLFAIGRGKRRVSSKA